MYFVSYNVNISVPGGIDYIPVPGAAGFYLLPDPFPVPSRILSIPVPRGILFTPVPVPAVIHFSSQSTTGSQIMNTNWALGTGQLCPFLLNLFFKSGSICSHCSLEFVFFIRIRPSNVNQYSHL